jgi:signal peptidase II
MTLYQSIPVIHNIFHITYVVNYGAAFGILKNQRVFFIVSTILIFGILAILYNQIKVHNNFTYIFFTLIISGAIGNFIDRVRFGYVIDFFDFRVFPVFNIADSLIVVGVIIFSFYLLFLESKFGGVT